MPRVLLSQAKPGQRVVRPITNASGVVMVQPGTELTAHLIERLQSWGIDSVSVAAEGAAREISVERALADLDARFAGHEQDTWMMQLKAIVALQIQKGASPDHA